MRMALNLFRSQSDRQWVSKRGLLLNSKTLAKMMHNLILQHIFCRRFQQGRRSSLESLLC
jgi:hypothetical protein